jgi:CRP-like cAMP-binding protein
MDSPLARKLSSFIDLAPEEVARLDALSRSVRRYGAGKNLIKEGDRPEFVFLLVDGWAYRYKVLPDGRRQIMAYLIPGDLCDIHIFILKEMDHSIGLLSNAQVAAIPKQAMLDLIHEHPRIGEALFWSTLVDEGVLREWLVNLGQRDAFQRIAHLFCEMWLRMCQVGLTEDGEFSLPLTQEQLGDTMGLTSVHVNRVLQRMRAEGLISLSSKNLAIHDIDRLKQIAQFDPNYLHLERRN